MSSLLQRVGGALSRRRVLGAVAAAAILPRADAAPPAPGPAHLLPQIQLFAPEPVRIVWPAAGRRVNAPPLRRVVVPGQGIAIAVFAEGDGRDALLQGATFVYRIRLDGKETAVGPHRADAVKAVKAEGADFVVQLLGAAGVADADRKKVNEATTLVSVAAVLPDWTAPDVKMRREAVVEGEATLAFGEKVRLVPARFAVETWAAAAAAPPFRDPATLQQWMNGYALAPEPQHLGAALRIAAGAGAHPLAVLGFPTHAIEVAPPGAVPAVVAALKDEDERSRALGAVALRWARKDASALVETLSPEWRTRVEAFPAPPGGYALDPAPSELDATTKKMDLLWGELMATGRPEPVRAIADLLRYRDDYSVFAEARKTPGKKKETTPALARGVLYMTAGWSLASFARGSPIVADYVAAWQEDETVPPVVRDELRRLLVNEAFRPPAKQK
jgi:hypothetical protein